MIQGFHHWRLSWIQIAEERLRAAELARSAMSANDPSVHLYEEEFAASLTTVSASAFGLEAFRNEFAIKSPANFRPPSGRKATFGDHLGQALVEAGLIDEERSEEIRWLVAKRHEAVHPTHEWSGLVAHPSGFTNVAPSLAAYTVEDARRAAAIVRHVASDDPISVASALATSTTTGRRSIDQYPDQ